MGRQVARYQRDDQEFGRAIGFFDATYALALTLLVTTLDITEPSSQWDGVRALWDAIGPQFLAFGISFAVIASYWLAHHRLANETPAVVIIRWPAKASVLQPRRFLAAADGAARVFAAAAVRLAQIRRERKL